MDENKRRGNLEKHGIDFADALHVFADPNHVVFRSHVLTDEERYLTVGMIGSRYISVVFVRRDEFVRIISARYARRDERNRYENAGRSS